MKQNEVAVYVGDFGTVRIAPETLEAYGLTQWPINRRSSKQRNALKDLEQSLSVVQRYMWKTGSTPKTL